MTKQEFTLMAIEVVKICIDKNIHFELDLDSRNYKSYLIVHYSVYSIYISETQDNYVEMLKKIKKLVKGYMIELD